jgi:hypothetical protein
MPELFAIQVIQADCGNIIAAEKFIHDYMGPYGYWTMMILLIVGIGIIIITPIAMFMMLINS